MLRGEEFPARLARISGIVRDQKFIGIAEQINLAVLKPAKIQARHAFEHGRQTLVFLGNRTTEAVAGRIKISKKAFDVLFRRVANRRRLDGPEYLR